MSTREKIISQIKNNKPPRIELTEIPTFESEVTVAAFKKNLEVVSGNAIEVSSLSEVEKTVNNLFPSAQQIASNVMKGTIAIDETSERATLELTEVAILKGDFGVAENGAIWLPESNMLNRSLPFITQNLILVIRKEEIVSNMHEAYGRSLPGSYGSFITGPSKTADIEQSLVIGAHGARSLTVILY